MRQHITIFLVSALILPACGGGAEEPASVLETIEVQAGDTPTTSLPTSPGEATAAAFRGISPPSLAVYATEPDSPTDICRGYTSSSSPFDIVTDHAADLEALGWDVSGLIRTGYRHTDRAEFTATKGDRRLHAAGVGDSPTRAAYVVCVRDI